MKRKTVNKLLTATLATAFVCMAGGLATLTPYEVKAITPTQLSDVSFDMLYGASMRVATAQKPDVESGLRFSAKISLSDWDWLDKTYNAKNISFGTVIVPVDYNNEVPVTVDSLFGENATYYWEGKTQTTETTEIIQMDSNAYPYFDEETKETYMRVNGSISSIKQANYYREFFGVCYMAIHTNNGVEYILADNNDNERSIVYVSQRAMDEEGWSANSNEYKTAQNFVNTYIDNYKNANASQMPTVQYDVNLIYDDGYPTQTATYTAELGEKITLDRANYVKNGYGIDASSQFSGTAYANDNSDFNIYYKKIPSNQETTPTFEQAMAGFTYNWTDTYTSISNAKREILGDTSGLEGISDLTAITNATAKKAMLNSDGFSSTVMHLTSSGVTDYDINCLSNNAPYLFQEGWTYTFEIDYYAVSLPNHYLIALDNANNKTFAVNPFKTGLGKAVIEYTVSSGDNQIIFYTESAGFDVYIGNFKLILAEPQAVRNDFHAVTENELRQVGGYTYDWSTNNAISLSANATYYPIDSMQNADLKANLQKTYMFGQGYALRLSGLSNSLITCLENMFVDANTYTVEFDAYVVTAGRPVLLVLNAQNQQSQPESAFTITDNGNGTKHYKAQFTADLNSKKVSIYIVNRCDLYLANIKLSATQEMPTARTDFYTPTYQELINGYNFDFANNNAIEFSANTDYYKISTLSGAPLRTALQNTGAFTNDYALRFVASDQSTSYITCLDNKLYAGDTYTLSFNAYRPINTGNFTLLTTDANGTQTRLQNDFTVTAIDANKQFYHYSVTFTVENGDAKINLYTINACELYISSIAIQVVPTAGAIGSVSGTLTHDQLNRGNAGTIVPTIDDLKPWHGFSAHSLRFMATNEQIGAGQANQYYELFQVGFANGLGANIIPTHEYREFGGKIQLILYIYVHVDFEGTLKVSLDQGNEITIIDTAVDKSMLGKYQAFVIEQEDIDTLDFVSLMAYGTGTIYLGSIDYTVQYKCK